MVTKVNDAIEDGDGAVLSVFVAAPLPGELWDDVVRRICVEADVPHSKIQVSTVARLREADFVVVHAVGDGEAACHHHVHFAVPMTESQAACFIECFDEPILNPTGGKRRPR